MDADGRLSSEDLIAVLKALDYVTGVEVFTDKQLSLIAANLPHDEMGKIDYVSFVQSFSVVDLGDD